MAWQVAGKHAWIKLVRLTVEVNEAAGHAGAEHGCAMADAGQEELVDVAVFRLSEFADRKTGQAQKAGRKITPAVRGVEHGWSSPLGRRDDFKRG